MLNECAGGGGSAERQAPAVVDPAVADAAVADPAVVDPAVADPAVADAAVVDPTVADPAVVDLTVADPTVTDPAAADPTAADPAAADPAVVDAPEVDPTVIDPDAAEKELAELSSHLDAATHRQLVLIRALDESGHWHRQGAMSCAHWLSWRVGLDLGAARERIRVGRALSTLPAIDDALRRGQLSYSKVRAMTRVATPENESKLLAIALESTASQLERVCRGVRRQQAEDGNDELERWVRLRHRGDPTVRVEAELLPDEAERVMEALRVVRATLAGEVGDAEKPSLADALVRMADEVLAARKEAREAGAKAPETRTSGADRADILIYLGPDPLNETHAATLENGARVSAECR